MHAVDLRRLQQLQQRLLLRRRRLPGVDVGHLRHVEGVVHPDQEVHGVAQVHLRQQRLLEHVDPLRGLLAVPDRGRQARHAAVQRRQRLPAADHRRHLRGRHTSRAPRPPTAPSSAPTASPPAPPTPTAASARRARPRAAPPTAPRPPTARSRARRASPPPAPAAPPTTSATSRPTPAPSRSPATPASTATPASASPTPARRAHRTPASRARPATPARSPRPARSTGMCRTALTKCSKDTDCPTGDTCGPATSRFVIAKRVLSSIVANNTSLVNFGLMTFYQGSYFPYFSLSSATTSTQTAFIQGNRLNQYNCYDDNNGPSSTCTINGVTYTLRSSVNSSYRIRGLGRQQRRQQLVRFVLRDLRATAPATTAAATTRTRSRTARSRRRPASRAPTSARTRPSAARTIATTTRCPTTTTRTGRAPRRRSRPPTARSASAARPAARAGTRSWRRSWTPPTTRPRRRRWRRRSATAMQPASYGGLIAYNGTPTGCALENSGAANKNASAFDYMKAVQAADKLTCRQDYVLLVTDGEANGPGDLLCESAACAAADPKAAGCTCKAVLAAQDLKKIGVKTFVVGFSGDVSIGTGKAANDNIAKAGGTDRGGDNTAPYAYNATSESELVTAIQSAIYDAVKGSYSTSPPAVSAGTQLVNSVSSGSYALDSRVDFPSWKGHLLAYDATASGTTLVWDAAVQLANMDWKTRRVYTSDTSGNLVQIAIDPSTGAITNKTTLTLAGPGRQRQRGRAGRALGARRSGAGEHGGPGLDRQLDADRRRTAGRRSQPGRQGVLGQIREPAAGHLRRLRRRHAARVLHQGRDHQRRRAHRRLGGVRVHPAGDAAGDHQALRAGRPAARSQQAHLRPGQLGQGQEHLHRELHRQDHRGLEDRAGDDRRLRRQQRVHARRHRPDRGDAVLADLAQREHDVEVDVPERARPDHLGARLHLQLHAELRRQPDHLHVGLPGRSQELDAGAIDRERVGGQRRDPEQRARSRRRVPAERRPSSPCSPTCRRRATTARTPSAPCWRRTPATPGARCGATRSAARRRRCWGRAASSRCTTRRRSCSWIATTSPRTRTRSTWCR